MLRLVFFKKFTYHHIQRKAVSNIMVKKSPDTLSDEEPPPCMSRWPKLLQVAETDWYKKAVEGYQKGIKVITQMNDSADNARVLVLLFQRTSWQTIPTVGKRQYSIYVCHWYQKEDCLLEEKVKQQNNIIYQKSKEAPFWKWCLQLSNVFWCIMNSPSLLTIAKKGKQWT